MKVKHNITVLNVLPNLSKDIVIEKKKSDKIIQNETSDQINNQSEILELKKMIIKLKNRLRVDEPKRNDKYNEIMKN